MRVLVLLLSLVSLSALLLGVASAASYCPAVPENCSAPLTSPKYDIRGNDLYAFSPPLEELQPACAAQCCGEQKCQAFVYGITPNDLTPNCAVGRPCCWLKSVRGTLEPTANAITAAQYNLTSNSSPTSSKCPLPTQYSGFDLPGGDLLSFDTSDTGVDANRCSSACCATAGCVSFLVGVTPNGSASGCTYGKPCCWLKSSVPQFTRAPSTFIGAAAAILINASCPVTTWLPGNDMGSNDLTSFTLPAVDLTTCSAACCATTGCRAFVTGISPNVNTPNCPQGRPCCWLKYAVGSPGVRDGFTTGVIGSPAVSAVVGSQCPVPEPVTPAPVTLTAPCTSGAASSRIPAAVGAFVVLLATLLMSA